MPVEPNPAYTKKFSHDDPQARIKVYFLQASRSLRVVWLLEALSLPYSLDCSERIDYVKLAPASFKDRAGSPMGKFPVVYDDGELLLESGMIMQHLCDKYDTQNGGLLMPVIQGEGGNGGWGDKKRVRERDDVVMWLHAAEGTIMLHALAILYARWQFPEALKESHPEAVEEMVSKLKPNVTNDLKWVEKTLEENGGWLVGERLTAADIMMEFSVDFLLERELGAKRGEFKGVDAWLERCHGTESYRRAVAKTGYTLQPQEMKL